MFGRIAGRYDLGNRILSFGRDQSWRHKAVHLLAPRPNDTVLDLGAGTADLSILLAPRVRSVVAADFSRPMLDLGRGKAEHARRSSKITFAVADAHGLPFRDASFDGATTAFTMRNLERMQDGFREIQRVLKPGAKLVCLEFTRPGARLVDFVYRPYLNHVLPFVGGLLSGHRTAYAYLAGSIENFSTPRELAKSMRSAGFDSVEYRLLNFGTVAIHMGTKSIGGGNC